MARVFTDERVFLTPLLAPVERGLYRVFRVDPDEEQDWKALRPLDAGRLGPRRAAAVRDPAHAGRSTRSTRAGFNSGTWDVSFNTASSFVTNTNWQFYGGETTMSNFSQMAGLAVQNFLSAAVGIAVLVALMRGIAARHGNGTLGNFYKDLTRIVLYILVPIAVVGDDRPRLPGRRADARRNGRRHRARPGRLAGGDQGARHQRRRLLQRQLVVPVRERDGLLELLRDVPDPAAFRRRCRSPTDVSSAAAARAGRSSPRWSCLFAVSVAVVYIAEQHGTPAQHLAGVSTQHLSRQHRRQHGGQGRALRRRRIEPLDRHHDGDLLRCRQCGASSR